MAKKRKTKKRHSVAAELYRLEKRAKRQEREVEVWAARAAADKARAIWEAEMRAAHPALALELARAQGFETLEDMLSSQTAQQVEARKREDSGFRRMQEGRTPGQPSRYRFDVSGFQTWGGTGEGPRQRER
jgi:replicative superfamily II helicase